MHVLLAIIVVGFLMLLLLGLAPYYLPPLILVAAAQKAFGKQLSKPLGVAALVAGSLMWRWDVQEQGNFQSIPTHAWVLWWAVPLGLAAVLSFGAAMRNSINRNRQGPRRRQSASDGRPSRPPRTPEQIRQALLRRRDKRGS